MPRSSACVDENTVAELLEGRRRLADSPEIESHVAGCADCRELLANMSVGVSAEDPALAPTVAAGEDAGAASAGSSRLGTVAEGRYELVRELARGGMGRILEARDLRHERTVAIKMLLRPGAEATRRFVREARITARLQHPAIVPLYEAGRWTSGEPFFAMKHVLGQPLSAVVQDRATLRDKLSLLPNLIAVTEALAYAHDQGVVHRDLKPSNILIGAFGETVVIDWGLAKEQRDAREEAPASTSSRGEPWHTGEGRALGTIGYMPPEQARGAPVDERADVYALGAVLYYVFAGRSPHASASFDESVDRLLAGPPEPLAKLVPELAPDLVAVVDKAMARDPADRYATAHEMARDLESYAQGRLVAAHSYSLAALVGRFVRRHRTVVTMAAALVLAVGVTAAFSVRRIVRERDRADALKVEADRQRSVAVTQRDAAEKLVGFVIGELKAKLEGLGKLDLLAGIGTQVLDYYRTLAPVDGAADEAALKRRGAALAALTTVEAQKLDWQVAQSLARATVDVFDEAHWRDPLDLDVAARAVVASAVLTQVLDNGGDGPGAAAATLEADRAASELAASEPTDPRDWTAVAFAFGSIAGTRSARDDLAGAKVAAARSKDAFARVPDAGVLEPEWQDLVFHARMNVCRMGLSTSDWALASDACGDAVSLVRRQLATEPDHVVHLRSLARARLGMAFTQKGLGFRDAAVSAFRESGAIDGRLLAREPQNLTVRFDEGFALANLCELESSGEDSSAALPDCDAALAALEPVVAARPDDARASTALGYALRAKGMVYLEMKRPQDARPMMERALERFQRASAKDPDSDIHRSDLSGGYRDVAEVEDALGHRDAARASYLQGIALDEKQLAEHPTARFFEGHVGSLLMNLGNTERARPDLPAARDAYERAITHFERAVEGGPTDASDATDLGLACLLRAQLEPDPTRRADLRRRARDVAGKFVEEGKVSPEMRAQLRAAGL